MADITVHYHAFGNFFSVARAAIRARDMIGQGLMPNCDGAGTVSFLFNGMTHVVADDSTVESLWERHNKILDEQDS